MLYAAKPIKIAFLMFLDLLWHLMLRIMLFLCARLARHLGSLRALLLLPDIRALSVSLAQLIIYIDQISIDRARDMILHWRSIK